MPPKMKKGHKSTASVASLDRKDKHASPEIKGKLGSSRTNDGDHSKLKMPCSVKTTQESGKKKENLDKKDKHVSSENKGRLGNSRSSGEGDCNVKTLSKKNKSGKSNGSLDRKGDHVSSKNEGRLSNRGSYGEGDPNLKMPSKNKKAHKSTASILSLDRKDKRVSPEIKGKLSSGRTNGNGHSKVKMPCLMQKTQVSGKRKENLDKKDDHVSAENKGRLGNGESGGKVDCNVKTLSKTNKRCESGKSNGSIDRKEKHVSLKNEGRHGNLRSDVEGDPHLKALSKRKKQRKSRKKNQSLENKDEHGSLENDDRICNSSNCDEGDPNLKMCSKMKKTDKSTERVGSLDKKDKHVSSKIKGKLGSSRINGKGHSKMKIPLLIKKTQESGKRKENHDKKDEHVSPETEGMLGNRRSGGKGDCDLKTLSKWKKRCESGKSNGSLDRKEEHVSSKNEGRLGNSMDHDDERMNLKKTVVGGIPGRWIGKVFVSNTEITRRSNGTIVLEGFYEGRSVAVKRLVLARHAVALQEIESLTASDQDPNIVRLYGAECDQDFVYLALERCACSLDDLIRAHSNSSEKSVFPRDPASNAMQLDLVEGTMLDVNLWREDGHPSPLLIKLMRDVVSGLVHLHRSGIIHRDLKPQNVLITKELCAKLSDMGISRLLPGDASSSEYLVSDCGRSGLQASEQLCPAQRMCSVDAFGLGRVLFFCVTGGRHPFKDSLKGKSNIEKNTMDLSPVEFMPEAADLFARLLNPNPNLRPKALEVLHHPLFWDSKKRLSFHREISDWVQPKARGGTDPDLLEKLESIAQRVFDEEWNGKIDCEFIKHMGKFKAYEFKKVTDLLRIVRNTFSHYRELPPEIQEIVGTSPEDLDSYFTRRFPKLLIETYRFVSMCGEDDRFPEYFNQ
ncbi:serine/threonine-protein kinase/endoribonuclease IRE1b [Eucalyptus grandis]|uniref:serine/threonine-protein kinase/endoribonuclease IRE1b n=1 Tax=Eucalyptus grandis TaxID=71139 RepID=UPI00192E8582|nr:serine/threonine-protein kinase/endoribonuclease IRE1b [Eucalyptus grandis]